MKKFIGLITLLMIIVLAGCSEDAVKEKQNPPAEKKIEETKEVNNDVKAYTKESGEGYLDGIGYVKKISEFKPGDYEWEIGPMKFEVFNINILEIDLDEIQYGTFDEESIKVIVPELKTENMSDEDVHFYTNQIKLVTDTGEQLSVNTRIPDEAGGIFLGKVKKEGKLWFQLKDKDSDIKNIKMVVPGPFADKTMEDLSEGLRIDFEMIPFKAK